MRFSRRPAAICGLTLLFTTGCDSVLGLDNLNFDDSDAGRTGPSAGKCQHHLIPEPSSIPGQDDSATFIVAVRTIDLGDSEAGNLENFREVGYDLDGVCTGQAGEGAGCRAPSWPTNDHPDGPGGEDNAFATEVIATLRARRAASLTLLANASAETGAVAMVFRIKGYNAQSVDGQVDVAVYAGTTDPSPGEGAVGEPPSWDGVSEWLAFEETLVNSGSSVDPTDRPKYHDAKAFVKDGTLVAQFDEVLTGAGLLSKVVLTARIDTNETPWVLKDGIFASRFKINEVLRVADRYKDTSTNGPLCTDSPNYHERFKQPVCRAVDISASNDPSARCDAISWAWKIKETRPAKFIGVTSLPPYIDPCGERSPSLDSCDSDR